MLLSFALILLGGLILGELCKKLKLPPLLGMLFLGIIIGPYSLNWIDNSVLSNSTDIRQIALIIILLRAGLNLDLNILKKVGKTAVFMCFVPASFEIIGATIFSYLFLGLSIPEGLVLGSVLGAVSPAVVVPHMLKLIDEGYGTEKGIPQLILAGASADDIYVIVLFTCFTGLVSSGTFDVLNLLRIPTSIIFGIFAGYIIGILLSKLFDIIDIKNSFKVILLMGISFLLVVIERNITGNIGFSGLLAIMSLGMVLSHKSPEIAEKISGSLNELWSCAEIFLFVLVGAAVNISYAFNAGISILIVIFGALLIRMIGVYLSVLPSKLNSKERLFTMLAYTPKATVQAAIGALPLSMGLKCGNTVLTAAVIAIIITAPMGAFLIDLTYKKLLTSH